MNNSPDDFDIDEKLSFEQAQEHERTKREARSELAALDGSLPNSGSGYGSLREAELARVEAEKELIPHLPPPPHQLSKTEEAKELEQFRIQAKQELENDTEERLLLHKAEELLSGSGRVALISLAIGYARIGETLKAKELINNYLAHLKNEPVNKALAGQNHEVLEQEMWAEVAYYSGWRSFSTDDDIRKVAENTKNNSTEDFSHRLLTTTQLHDFYQLLNSAVSLGGESAIFAALQHYEQESTELHDAAQKVEKLKKLNEKNSDRTFAAQREYVDKTRSLKDQRVVLGIIMMELAEQVHKKHLAAISRGEVNI